MGLSKELWIAASCVTMAAGVIVVDAVHKEWTKPVVLIERRLPEGCVQVDSTDYGVHSVVTISCLRYTGLPSRRINP